MAPFDPDAVEEDHRHGVFEHSERKRAEEDHDKKTDNADYMSVLHKRLHLRGKVSGVAGYNQFKIRGNGAEEKLFLYEMGKDHKGENQRRHDGKQCVVGDGAREEQSLIAFESPEDPLRKREEPRKTVCGFFLIHRPSAPIISELKLEASAGLTALLLLHFLLLSRVGVPETPCFDLGNLAHENITQSGCFSIRRVSAA